MNPLRRQTYRPGLVALARGLHISGILAKCYYRWTAPSDGIFHLRVAGLDAQFHVGSPGELRLLESFSGIEEMILRLLLSKVCAGDVVYDIGGNIGQFTIPLAEAVGDRGQVIAFEPERHSYKRLQENVKLNGLTNVRAFRVALGDKNSEERLFLRGFHNRQSSLLPGNSWSERASQPVDVVQGGQFLNAERLPPPRAIKIDVEGYEYFVVRGLRDALANPTCVLMCCEIHPQLLPKKISVETIIELVKTFGFSRNQTYPRGSQVFLVAHKGECSGRAGQRSHRASRVGFGGTEALRHGCHAT